MTVVERWPLVEVRLYASTTMLVVIEDYEIFVFLYFLIAFISLQIG